MTYLFNGRQEQVEAGRLVLFWAAIPHQTIAVAENAPLICLYLPLVDFLGLPVDRKARQSIMQGSFLAQANQETMDALITPTMGKGMAIRQCGKTEIGRGGGSTANTTSDSGQC